MAPEQLRHWHDSNVPCDHRADIYSLGVVLYQLLTGRLPSRTDDAVPGSESNVTDALAWRLPASRLQFRGVAVRQCDVGQVPGCSRGRPLSSAAELHDDLRRQLQRFAVGRGSQRFAPGISGQMDAAPSTFGVGHDGRHLGGRHLFGHSSASGRSVRLGTVPLPPRTCFTSSTSAWDDVRADLITASMVPGWADEVISQAEGLLDRFGLEAPASVDPYARSAGSRAATQVETRRIGTGVYAGQRGVSASPTRIERGSSAQSIATNFGVQSAGGGPYR